MNKQLKDYLHLYLGCELSLKDGLVTDTYTLTTYWLNWFVDHPKEYENNILHLRPLSDMTDEEAKEIGFWSAIHNCITGTQKEHAIYDLYTSEKFRLSLSNHFDLFGLIEAGLAIDKTTFPNQ